MKIPIVIVVNAFIRNVVPILQWNLDTIKSSMFIVCADDECASRNLLSVVFNPTGTVLFTISHTFEKSLYLSPQSANPFVYEKWCMQIIRVCDAFVVSTRKTQHGAPAPGRRAPRWTLCARCAHFWVPFRAIGLELDGKQVICALLTGDITRNAQICSASDCLGSIPVPRKGTQTPKATQSQTSWCSAQITSDRSRGALTASNIVTLPCVQPACGKP